MKVTLVAAPIMDVMGRTVRSIAQDATRNCPPYGLYLLAGILRNNGHDVFMADMIANATNSVNWFRKAIVEADLIGLTTTSLAWPTALDAIGQIRAINPHVPIVLGGIHATIFDVYLLKQFPIQFVIRGEGEIAFPSLCFALENRQPLDKVPNLSWKSKSGDVTRNKLGPLMKGEHLAAAAMPAYDLLPSSVYQGLSIESSRGCAFDCSFCSTSYRQTWRDIPPEIFVDRLEQLLPFVQRSLHHTVHIVDDEFSLNTKRATAIARVVQSRNLDVQFVYDVRANDILDDDFTNSIAPYTNQFLVGAECGYDEGLIKIGKKTTCAILEEAAQRLSGLGMADRGNFSFIIGLPWETKREIEQTIEFASHLFQDYGVKILLQPYCLIPGSRLWQEQRDKLVVSEPMYDEYGFFRNLHFFCASARVTPAEAWELEDLMLSLKWLGHLMYPGRQMVQHAVSPALIRYFPRDLVTQREDHAVHLGSLREVSHPKRAPLGSAPQKLELPILPA